MFLSNSSFLTPLPATITQLATPAKIPESTTPIHRLEFLLESAGLPVTSCLNQNHVAVIGEEGPTIFLPDSRTVELNQQARNGQRNHLNRNDALAAQTLHGLLSSR